MALTDENAVITEPGRFCPSCGEPAGAGRYCPSCGHALPLRVGTGGSPMNTNSRGPVENNTMPAIGATHGPAPSGSGRRMAIIVLAVLGLVAIAIAAIIIANGSSSGSLSKNASSDASSAAAYRGRLQSALSPVIAANQALSSDLTAMDGSGHTVHAAQNAATAAQSAVTSARGAVSVLSPPSSGQTLFQQVQQALADDSGYVQAVSATLTTPTSPSASQLQTLATSVESSLVPINSLASGASNSVSGTSNLVSWANSAARAANRPNSQPSSQSSSSGSANTVPASSRSAGASSNPDANGTDCGGGLYAGANTSCPFAESVQQAYDQAPGAVATVQAFSPVTNQTYTMSCAPAGAGVTCSGANNASVSW